MNLDIPIENYTTVFKKKRGVLIHFAKFTGKHLCQSFLIKLQASGLINTFLAEHLQPQLIRFLSKEFMALQSDIWRLLLRAFCFFSINFSIVNFSCSIHYSPVLLFYTPWKHQKTFRFSDVLRGYIKATPGCNGLKPICRSLAIFYQLLFEDMTLKDNQFYQSSYFEHKNYHGTNFPFRKN